MTTPERPDAPMSNADDPEWVKGVVAKALLHAADGGLSDTPLAPTPSGPPAAAWPELAPLDTSSFARNRAESATAPTPAAEPSQTSVATPPQAAESAPATPAPREAQHSDVVVRSPETLDQEPNRLVDEPTPADVGLPAVATHAVSQDVTQVAAQDAPDAVMVESSATTEGFRSSDIRTVLEWLAVIVTALIVALLIKAVVLQAFWIPSESMETTVNKGDRILVNKVSYRLHEVRRGDLVVFEKLEGSPGDTKDLIKRAIALPGETIELRSDGRIWIWGPGETAADAKLLQEPYLDPQNAVLNAPSASDPLSGDIWDERCVNQPRTPGRCTLDESSYFMMGDNRNRSSDSRFFGPVPDENIVGRAFLRIWPLGEVGTL